jgi:hypothetical protein
LDCRGRLVKTELMELMVYRDPKVIPERQDLRDHREIRGRKE